MKSPDSRQECAHSLVTSPQTLKGGDLGLPINFSVTLTQAATPQAPVRSSLNVRQVIERQSLSSGCPESAQVTLSSVRSLLSGREGGISTYKQLCIAGHNLNLRSRSLSQNSVSLMYLGQVYLT